MGSPLGQPLMGSTGRTGTVAVAPDKLGGFVPSNLQCRILWICRALWKIAIQGLFHTVNSDAFAGNAFSGSRLLLPPAPEPSSAAGKAAAAAFSAVFPSF